MRNPTIDFRHGDWYQEVKENFIDLDAQEDDPIIDDTTNNIKYYAGGRWVTQGEDPATHYPSLVQDGHYWIEVSPA